MAYVTESEIERARKLDLFSYLQVKEPHELVRCGRDEYCTKTHDSLRISNGKWFWWSRGIGGVSALDYLVKVKGIDFVSAVTYLNGVSEIPRTYVSERKVAQKIYLPPCNYRCQTVKPYLLSRGIDGEIVDMFIENRQIAEDSETGYALFFGKDEKGNVRQCSVRATDGSVCKKEVAGSDRGFCFHYSTEKEPTALRLFESAIDLLSFMTLEKRSGKPFRGAYLSLSGVYMPKKNIEESKLPKALQTYLEKNPIEEITLHLDADFAGRRGAEAICTILDGKYDVKYVPPPRGKDFNEYLQSRYGSREKVLRKREEMER